VLLQQRRLNLAARRHLRSTSTFGDVDTLDDEIEALRRTRSCLAREAGPLASARERLDRALRSEREEFIDRVDYGDTRRVGEIRALDRYHRLLFNYPRLSRMLLPSIRRIAQAEGRPARLLELASGHGALSLHLARSAAARGWPVEVTGSDIQPAYVDEGNRRAQAAGLPVQFMRQNAFELDVAPGAFDLAFIALSIHHLSPRQLGRALAQASAACPHGVIAIDGKRSLWLLGWLAISWAPTLNPYWLHDAVVTGMRFYSAPELQLIGERAAPDRRVRVTQHRPGLCALQLT
jgi:2-polyprenyl-3-methyl-5-hydroxy-6-metoxy-1,4-benzoquinol methylase